VGDVGPGQSEGDVATFGRSERRSLPPTLDREVTISDVNDLQWAIQRRIEDVFAKLGEKFGDLTGRVETSIRPNVSFDDVGGLREAKAAVRGFAYALTSPELYAQWGIRPPRGLLLYGPPGTGKATLARALATAAGAIFYHLKLTNLTTKFGANTGELLQEILRIAANEGKAVLFLDEADALALEHLLPPPQAREASARLVAALCEKLDGLDATARILVLASTSRTDAIDPTLVAPGRLDHLVEVALPDAAAQQEIFDLIRSKIERAAGRSVFASIDYRTVLPVMGGMSGAEISQIVQRALEVKVHRMAERRDATPVTTEDVLRAIDEYKRVRGVVEKIRYGQYL
jgi:ATP-dependent 26S proteasome regulatory subunit